MPHGRKRRGYQNHHGRITDKKQAMTGRGVAWKLNDPPPEAFGKVISEAFDAGWPRWLPIEFLDVLAAASDNLEQSVGEPDAFELLRPERPLWEHPASDPDDVALRDRQRFDARRFASHVGLAFPETVGDLGHLMEALGLIVRTADGLRVMARPLPLVTEAGVLTTEEAAQEDKIRWRRAFEDLEQRVLRFFVSSGRNEWRATLNGMAQQLDADPEDLRQALAILVESEDFEADKEPATTDLDDELVLTVDWEAFDKTRIRLS